MTSAILALPNALPRLSKSLLWNISTSTLKSFSTSLTTDAEETPAMKALRDIPYPSASADPSIFESWSDEYSAVSVENPTPSSSTSGSHHPSAVLEKLSRGRRFAEAEEVREELVGMGVPIRHSIAYHGAAWNVLRQRPWPPHRAERFANWLSLLPTFAENKKSTHFSQLKSALLFSSSNLDLESVARFGVVLSSKGYIRSVGATVVACLTRYADPETSSRILDEMMAADDYYKRNKLGFKRDADTRFKDTSKRLWGIVVRTHCSVGRPKVALQVAKKIHERGISLSKYTYQYLLGKLETDGLHDLAAEIRALPGCQSLDVAKSRFIVEDIPNPSKPIPSISPNRSFHANETLALSILKQSSLLGLPTYATDIVPYFDLYKTGVRGGPAVIKLRSHAYELSLAAVSTVLLAELLHHHRRGEFTHVLWVFEKFFHVVGVPPAEVTRRLWRRDHYPPHRRLHYWALPPRITETTSHLPFKLSPTAHHTALIWTALVQLCDSGEEEFTLYEQLLQRSAGRPPRQGLLVHHHHRHTGGTEDGVSHADQYDAAHFRPFLVANTLLRGAAHGLQVLDDMQDRGIAPSARILGTGASLQAR